MFQSFEVTSRPEQGPARLADLRRAIGAAGLDGFIIPRSDAHQGEYVAPCDERLAWLTGFSGSAGFCVVLPDRAGMFVDGRYDIQVGDQVDLDHFTPVSWPATQLGAWVQDHAKSGQRIGFDAWLHNPAAIERARKVLADTGIELVAVDRNLVDQIWMDRPAAPQNPITSHPIEFAGETSHSKRQRLGRDLATANADMAILTLPDSICWLLNIRGTDIAHNPVARMNAILHADGTCVLFAGTTQVADLHDHLGPDVSVKPYEAFADHLAGLTGQVQIDPNSAPLAVMSLLDRSGVTLRRADDPCLLPKAIKNEHEIDGMREAHLRDGTAMVRFLSWLDTTAPQGGLSEIDVVTALEGFRRDTNALREISFETICGAGEHGAIVHYRVSTDSNRAIKPDELLLVDSGGQYLDGTTDITRTVIVGTPSPDHRDCYTRVLQGMIAISRVRFPDGLTGRDLDSLARYPLWTAGLDYDHGTGHGVGAYLSVHEGPQRISRNTNVALQSGMILSNEPGYYRAGSFGIRIENLIVTQSALPIAGGDDRAMLSFETLTYVPLDRRLINQDLLSQPERDWINGYHADTVARIGPRVEGQTLDWLIAACAPL